jgi:hypothetical protein
MLQTFLGKIRHFLSPRPREMLLESTLKAGFCRSCCASGYAAFSDSVSLEPATVVGSGSADAPEISYDAQLCCDNCDAQMFSSGYAKFLDSEELRIKNCEPKINDLQYLANLRHELTRLRRAESLAGVTRHWYKGGLVE